jgi:hypothetical protein
MVVRLIIRAMFRECQRLRALFLWLFVFTVALHPVVHGFGAIVEHEGPGSRAASHDCLLCRTTVVQPSPGVVAHIHLDQNVEVVLPLEVAFAPLGRALPSGDRAPPQA